MTLFLPATTKTLLQDLSKVYCGVLPRGTLHVTSLFVDEGELAQVVERSLSMREVPGSMPGFSKKIFCFFNFFVVFCLHVKSTVAEFLNQLSPTGHRGGITMFHISATKL